MTRSDAGAAGRRSRDDVADLATNASTVSPPGLHVSLHGTGQPDARGATMHAVPAPDPTAAVRLPDPGDVLVAAAMAGALSGGPSTAYALVTGRSSLEAARAAGALLGKPSLWRGAVAHAAISIVWTWLLAAALPERDQPALATVDGAVAGGAIAALDLGLIGRRVPAIRALPAAPQVADHLAFGALAGWALDRRRRHRATADG